MAVDEIKAQVIEIAKSITGEYEIELDKEQEEKFLLQIILSNSTYAILLISLIEECYGIEIDDDDINMTFFSDFDYIAGCIMKYI